jgi:poly-gamma-glutamate synthesis protein (capsule biosynthesis protein)
MIFMDFMPFAKKETSMKLRKGRAFGAVTVLAALIAGVVSCNVVGSTEPNNKEPVTSGSPSAVTTEAAEPATEEQPDKVVHVVAAGDNLIHYSVYKNAEALAGGVGYDFKPMYSEVKYLVEGADLAILNQETIISQSNPIRGADGGQLIFNSPPEVADAVIDLGFDVFTMANNHLLDMGTDGLEESIRFWNQKAEENDLTVLGAYLNEEDVIERQIKEADQLADVVIVSAHWGEDDTTVVTDDRIELANKMVDWGADVILGCHTHTAETMEWIERDDGTKGFVYYSMGNFICAQTDNFNVVGEMPDFDIVIDGKTNELRLENVGCIPIIIHYESEFSNMKIYPYSKYSPELAERHGLPYAVPQGSYPEFGWDVINRIIDEQIPAEFRKLDK